MAQSLSQFDIDDDSPTIVYFPFVNLEPSPNISTGWQLLYSGSGAATSPGEVGVGTSYHYTSVDGASLLINWNGTGIDLIGSVSNASYNLSLDGTSYSTAPANTVLASFDDLENTNHSLLLTTIITNATSPDAFLTFDKARITFAPPAGSVDTTATLRVLNDSDIAYKGQWNYVTDNSGKSMHMSNSAGDRAETTFVGTAITIYGLTSSYSGNFSVTLDNITTSLSARSSYNDSETLLFYATNLPENMVHHVVVTNQENRTLALQVGGMNVTSGNYATSSPSSSSNYSLPAGTIAAIVLGIILFFVLAGIFYYTCIVRRNAHAIDQPAFTFVRAGQDQPHEKTDVERATNITPPSGEELECTSLSTSKGYGFGLGLRRSFPFAYRKSKLESSSSGRSRSGSAPQAESYQMTFQCDEKRLSINTLTEGLPVLGQAPESEKLAPGWSNPVARTPHSFKYGRSFKDAHGVSLPETHGEQMDPAIDDDDDADVKTLTSRQDETLAATLLLSPRTSEAVVAASDGMARSKPGTGTRGGTRQRHEQRHENQQPQFLQVRDISPFKIDMSPILGTRKVHRESRRTSESGGSTWSRVCSRLYRKAHRDDGRQSYHTDRQESSSSSGPESVPVVMHDTSSAVASSEAAPGSGTYSFLDLTSSHVSLRRHSKATLSSTPAEVGHGTREMSAWSETTSSIKTAGTQHARGDVSSPKPDAPSTASGGSSGNSGSQTARTQRSSPFPFPITIPLPTHTAYPSNNVPERHITPPPPPHSSQHQSLQVPKITPPELALIPADSPTESVPFSASEIHFRHSFSDYAGLDSRRGSVASVLPPHPPLPHRDGSQPNTPAYSPPPPYIVQRVLGLPISPLSHLSPTLMRSPIHATSSMSNLRRPGMAPTQSVVPSRVGLLLGPRPPSRSSTMRSTRGGSSAPQLPMQGGRSGLRGPR